MPISPALMPMSTGSIARNGKSRSLPPALAKLPDDPDHPLGKQQGYQDEQSSQEEQPDLRHGSGEPGLGQVDDAGAEHGADQGPTSTDGDPDGDFDRVAR